MVFELPAWFKPAFTVGLLAVFWAWESVAPYVAGRTHRWRHAGRNLLVAVFNTVVLSLVFGAVTMAIVTWTSEHHWGLLHRLSLGSLPRTLLTIVLLDGWLYVWHRLNHQLPWLWRFHRMHHSDADMDVTTATRFHLGEHLGAASLRLGLVALLGCRLPDLLVFEVTVVAVTIFHHANISLGPADRVVSWFLVSPRMHQVHHSRIRAEMNSNYATLLPVWDRIFHSYRMRVDAQPIELGLDDFANPRWQTLAGLLLMPLAPDSPVAIAEHEQTS